MLTKHQQKEILTHLEIVMELIKQSQINDFGKDYIMKQLNQIHNAIYIDNTRGN
jgi:hypothetical protein